METMVQAHLSRDFDSVELYPISDLHVGDPLHRKTDFWRFINHIQAQDNRFLILAGDLIDNATRQSVGDIYEAKMSPQEQKEYVIETLQPLADRVLFICDGNHEARNVRGDGQLITRDIAFALRKKDAYRAAGGFLQVTFGTKPNGKRRSYIGYIVHGSGGGATSGNALNKVDALSHFAVADFFVMGHHHRRIFADGTPQYRPDPQNGCINIVYPKCIVTGSWMDYGGYAQFKCMRPTAPGPVPFRLLAKHWAVEPLSMVA